MTEQELEQKVIAASTRSIMMFLERADTIAPRTLPIARIDADNVVFDLEGENNPPKMENGDVAEWKMERSADNLTDGFTWFTIGTFRGNGTQVGKWTSPICIRIGRDGENGLNGKPGEDGYDGTDGADGADIEYIFKLVDNEEEFNALVKPVGNPNEDDYIPKKDDEFHNVDDWEDHPSGITAEHRIEAMCYREKRPNMNNWTSFYGPYIWSNWGERGKDGDGVEYVFRLATLPSDESEGEAYLDSGTGIYHLKEQYWPPTNEEAYNALTEEQKELFNKNEYYPEGWVDDPLDVTEEKPIQFVSSRKYDGDKKKWGYFSEPTCWNKLPLADVTVTSFTSFSFTITPHDLSDYKPTFENGDIMDPDPDDFYYDEYNPEGPHDLITWSDSIPNNGVGFVWMTSAVFVDGTISEKGWAKPIKMNDSPGFQAEYSDDYEWWGKENAPKLPNFGECNEDESAWREAAFNANCNHWYDIWADNPNPDESIKDPTYMACCRKQDGKWTDWVIAKIKGENGLSPIVLHIDNVNIGVPVDGENKVSATKEAWVIGEVAMGTENFVIEQDKITIYNVPSGNFPEGITISDISVYEEGLKFKFKVTIQEGILFENTVQLGIHINNDKYDTDGIVELVPLPSADGTTYEIEANTDNIYRLRADSGAYVYEPERLIATGMIYVGSNAPKVFEGATIKYSVSDKNGESLFKIGDPFTEKDGVSDYQEGGIIINQLNNHESLKIIYLYLVKDDIVWDWENYEIDTKGSYKITLEGSNQIHIKNNTLTPNSIKIHTWYSVSNNDSPVTSQRLCYYFNGDTSTGGVSSNRNNSPISISSLSGFNSNTSKTLTFVLRDSNGNDLSNVISISFVKDGEDGDDGISISSTINYFKAAGENENITSPPVSPKSDIVNRWGWSETQVNLNDENSVLWQFIRVEYDDGSAKHLAAFPCRYYNQSANTTYGQIDRLIQDELGVSLEQAIERLEEVEDTNATINAYPNKGLIKLATDYKNSDGSKSFADFTANAANATIAAIVGSTIDDTTTTAGQKINGILGNVTTFAEQLKGVDKVEGAVQQLATNAITQAVSKSHYVWKAKDGVTLPAGQDKYLPYTSDDDDVNKTLYEKGLISDAMSTIKVEADKISLLTGTDGNFVAGIQIIANSANEENQIEDPARPGQYLPAGSVIVLDASNVVINGGLKASALEAQSALIKQIAADSIIANRLETGNIESETGMGTIIKDGQFDIYYNGKLRAKYGVSNGDIVLSFYDAAGQEQYNLGPAGDGIWGFNKVS